MNKKHICAECGLNIGECPAKDEDMFVDDAGVICDCVHFKKRTQKYIVALYHASDGCLIHQMYTNNIPDDIRDALDAEKNKIDYQQIADLFKSICTDLSKPRAITSARRQNIRNCKKQLDELNVTFEEYFKRIQASDFLCRMSSGRSWKADFDFVIKPSNLLKIIEGKYDNRQAAKQGSITSAPTYDLNRIAADARNNTEIKY